LVFGGAGGPTGEVPPVLNPGGVSVGRGPPEAKNAVKDFPKGPPQEKTKVLGGKETQDFGLGPFPGNRNQFFLVEFLNGGGGNGH